MKDVIYSNLKKTTNIAGLLKKNNQCDISMIAIIEDRSS